MRSVRLHARAAGLLVGAGVLFLIGTMVQAGWLYVLAALLLGALLAGLVLPFAALRGLNAELAVPVEATQGEPTTIELRLQNRRRGVRWGVRARDEHLEPADVFLAAVRPGERVDVVTARTPARRGAVATSSLTLRSAAPFGVADRVRRVRVGATTLVLPRVFPLPELPFVEEVGTPEPAIAASPRRGNGPDYLAVRSYRAGDPLRHVHWGLTAKHGEVMVREFEEERTRRLAIVVDTERDAGSTWTPLDRCCSVAASVAEAAAANGHGVRLAAALPDRSVEVLGRTDGGELLRWLARLEPSGEPLTAVLDRLGPDELRGVETVVVTHPAWRGRSRDPILEAAERLAGIVERVVLVPVMQEPVGTLAETVRPGVEVRPWRPDEELVACLGAPSPGGAAFG
ncbi:MAG TPA: DUF58 domain-containing protein [Actinomycetota bacterium]|nr:DUF58 domain-containing protein [Actinomycetota bacterium]